MAESALNDTFALDDDTPLDLMDRVGPNLVTNITSHLVCSALLTPLQLIRTRFVSIFGLPFLFLFSFLSSSSLSLLFSPLAEKPCRR